MKKHGFGLSITVVTLGFILWGLDSGAFGDTEINLDDILKPTPTLTSAQPVSTNMVATPTVTSLPAAVPVPTTVINMIESAPTPTETVEDDSASLEVHGVLKMKDIYAAGIKAYQEQDYDKAIRYLKKSLEMKDSYSAKFYYAEASAMLGVIYQFHIIHYNWAYYYYRQALRYEKRNPTARRHIKQVARYKNQKD